MSQRSEITVGNLIRIRELTCSRHNYCDVDWQCCRTLWILHIWWASLLAWTKMVSSKSCAAEVMLVFASRLEWKQPSNFDRVVMAWCSKDTWTPSLNPPLVHQTRSSFSTNLAFGKHLSPLLLGLLASPHGLPLQIILPLEDLILIYSSVTPITYLLSQHRSVSYNVYLMSFPWLASMQTPFMHFAPVPSYKMLLYLLTHGDWYIWFLLIYPLRCLMCANFIEK